MICPECKTEQSRRKDGACPNCGTPVDIYKTIWYRAGKNSPPAQLVTALEKATRKNLSSKKLMTVPFSIPRRGPKYKREVRMAEKLLEEADWDVDAALRAFEIIVDRRPGMAQGTLAFFFNRWAGAVAEARADLDRLRSQTATKERAQQSIDLLGGIFDNPRTDPPT